jgi:hypothetical protein
LAIQAWLRGVDCIVLARNEVLTFLNARETGVERIKQFKADIKPWFKFVKPYYKEDSRTYIRSLFLSRINLDSYLPSGTMTTDERMTKAIAAADGKFSIERFSRKDNKVPSEEEMVSDLALFATGLKTPKAF